MAAIEGDILEIVLVQTLFTEVCNNIFHYRLDDVTGTPTYDDILDAWAVGVLDKINDIQSADVNNVRTIVRNLTNGLDIVEDPNTAIGSVGAASSPSFVAYAFRLLRSTSLTRHGSKRFAGVDEGTHLDNSAQGSVPLLFDELETALGSPVEIDGAGGAGFLQPVIVGRTFVAGVPEEDTKDHYELDLAKINVVQGAQYIRITSQTTRRVGRGI